MFGWDPWGDLFDSMLEGVADLTETMFQTVFNLAAIRTDASWFREVYGATLWIALALAFVFLMTNVAMVVMRKLSPQEFLENITKRLFIFAGIAFYAPALAQNLASAAAKIGASLLAWGVTDSVETQTTLVQENILSIDRGAFTGGVMTGLVMLLFWQLALFGIMLALLVLSFFQYIGVLIFPMLFAFYTSAKHRHIAKKAASVMVGMFLAVPLMCLAIAITFRIFNAGVGATNNGVIPIESPSEQASGFWFLAVGLVGLVISTIVPLMVVTTIWKMGSAVMDKVGAAGSGAAATGGATTAAGAAKGTSAALGTAAVGAGVGSVAPGAGTAAGAGVGAAAGGAGAAGGTTAGAAAGAGASGSGAAASGAAGGSRGALSSATQQGLQQSAYAGQHSTQTATQGLGMSQADEREGGKVDD